MSDPKKPEAGTIGWSDLTVENADAVRDFYAEVVGWKPEALSMGDYSDYVMVAAGTGDGVAGICHARGMNAGLPSQWLVYIVVDDLDHSLRRCAEMGGKLLREPRDMGPQGRYCVIQDPAGAVAALFEPGKG
jgi:predicted enzyme related to lactoylglutathione lyase